MIGKTLLTSIAYALMCAVCSDALGANALRQTNINPGTSVGAGFVTTPPMGRACALIAGVGFESPAGGCSNVNGPIPPNRIATTSDAAGNSADGRAIQLFRVGAAKAYRVSATSKTVTRPTFAMAEYVDPLIFSNPFGDAFSLSLVVSLSGDSGSDPGIDISGDHVGDTALSHFEISTDRTGFLFAFDLDYAFNQPLDVDLTLGSYLSGLPASAGWNELQLEGNLRTLLDAGTPDNHFTLASFAFPAIPINVPAGNTLALSTRELVAATAAEPGSLQLLLMATLLVVLACRKKRQRG